MRWCNFLAVGTEPIMPKTSATMRGFLICWFLGWALFILVGILQPVAGDGLGQFGMEAHRRAGTADMVNAIHSYWQNIGIYDRATWSLVVDLLFITAFSIGGVLGGLLLRQNMHTNIRRVGLLAIVAHIVFAVSDYAETISQLIQMVDGTGSDSLANIAAFARPIKIQSFLIAVAAIAIGFIASKIVARKTAA